MKKIFSFLLFVFFMLSASSQQLYLETGMVISSFDYQNSEGNSLSDLTGSNHNNLELGVRMALFQTACHLSLGVSNNKYGATSSDQELGNYSEWNVSYIGANLGVDYEFFKPPIKSTKQNGFSFYIKGIFATEFLINGKQKLNNQVYDLDGVEEFDKPVYFLRGGVGGNYYITRSYIIFVQYMFGRSVLFGNYNGQEQLRFITHSVSIGFSINLFYDR